MKKLVFLLALCLCLNGTAALASEAAGDVPAGAEGGGAVAEERAGEAADEPEGGDAAEPAMEGGDPEPEEAPKAADDTIEEGPAGENDPGEASGNGAGEPAGEGGASQGAGGEGADPQAPAGGDADPNAPADTGEGTNPTDGEGNQTGEGENPGDAPSGENPPAGEDTEAGDPAQPGEGEENPLEGTEVPEDAEAWFERDGAKVGGRLEEILPKLTGGETLYIVSKNVNGVVRVQDVPLKPLHDVILKLDPEDKTRAIRVSRADPAGSEAPEAIELKALADCDDDEKGDLYFWIEPVQEPAPEPTPTEAPAPVLAVAAENYTPAQWSAEMPAFTLSGIPEGGDYGYAAVIYNERIIPLSGDTYVPDAEGKYTVRFALLDGCGDVVSASETYLLWLDATPPEKVTVAADEAQDYTLNITAQDGFSGVAGVSLNGGASWEPLGDGETYTYVGAQAETFSPGAIQVKDLAGNIWRNEAGVTIDAVEPEPNYGGGGGGGGGGGEGKAAPSHASGDGEEGAEYETLALELPEEPMKQLTVGGEPMALTLVLDAAETEGAPVGEEQPFTARLGRWCPAPKGEDAHENVLTEGAEPPQDTLILTAEPEADLGDAFTYAWRFNGEVYRLLANSGIKYVALQVGDDVAAFPTEGFTGGTKYTELKMLGVSTRKFDYTLTMKVNLDPGYVSAMSDSDFSKDCDLSIRAEVENMAYELSGSTNSIMYFYDVYLGPEDMMAQPFGQYRAEENEGTGNRE